MPLACTRADRIDYRSNMCKCWWARIQKLNSGSFRTLTPVPTCSWVYSRDCQVPEYTFNSGEEMKRGTEANWEMTRCYGTASSSLCGVYPAWEQGYKHDDSGEQKLHLIPVQGLLCVCAGGEKNMHASWICVCHTVHISGVLGPPRFPEDVSH